MQIRRRWLGLGIVLLLVVGSSACGGISASQKTTGPYAVGTRSLTFVDTARATPAFGDVPALPNRKLVTDIWYPAEGDPSAATVADAPAAHGTFPLIVFNHGQQGDPQQYTTAFEMWTRAGYVVAAPRHPITVTGGPGGHFVDDIPGELGDVSFVIDHLVDELGDLVDADHLAVAGHSSGAIVAYGVGFNTCCHDDRVDAVLVEALLKIPLDGTYAKDLKGTPVMFLHGTADEYPIAQAKAEFAAASAPKFFVTIEGGNHSEDFRVGPRAELAAKAALAFFDLELKGRGSALATIRGIAGMEAVPG